MAGLLRCVTTVGGQGPYTINTTRAQANICKPLYVSKVHALLCLLSHKQML